MKTRTRRVISLVLLAVAGVSVAPAEPPRRNVLLLLADDLNCDLGCYGAADVHTPNIDGLAKRGVTFERAYSQYPLCSPSRSSFMTGRRPNVTGVLVNPNKASPVSPHFRETLPDTITLPERFKRSGWFAARIGKVFHYSVPSQIGTSSHDDIYSWDLVINPRGRDREMHSKIFTLKPGSFGATLSWLADREGEDRDHTDGIGATEAIELLERFHREARPFFLAVGFYRPHTPFVAPQKYFDLYPREKITLPALSDDDRLRVPAAAYASAHPEEDTATVEQRIEAIQAYHASTSFMDAQVGRVVDALDQLGLSENTVIVFASDHGFHLGDHGLWQKHSLFERSARVPLIIAAPEAKGNGKRTRALTALLDLYPTLADLCEVAVPKYLDGKSQRVVLDDVNRSVRTAAMTQVGPDGQSDGYSVRTDRWRYTEWGGRDGGQILSDMENDPSETRNLAADPEHRHVVIELAKVLERERRTK